MFSSGTNFSDDIISNFLQNNTSKTTTKKTGPTEERNLLKSMKQSNDLDDDFGPSYNQNTIGKSTKTLAQTQNSKKRNGGDIVSDILDEIESANTGVPNRNANIGYAKTTTDFNKKESISFGGFMDDLADPAMDDELGDIGYNPSMIERKGTKRATTATSGFSEDMKIKRNNIFGIAKDTSMDSEANSAHTNKRPLTSDNKPVTMANIDDASDIQINATVSRRGKRSATGTFGQTDSRPFTSPGILSKDLPKNDPQLSGDDNRSNTELAYSNIPDNRNNDDDDFHSTSDYVFQGARTGNRKNSGGGGVPPRGIKIDTSETGPGQRDRDGTPGRMSPISQAGGNRETFGDDKRDHKPDHSRKESIELHMTHNATKSNNASSDFVPNISGVSRRKKPEPLQKADDQVSNAPHKISPRATDLGSPEIIIPDGTFGATNTQKQFFAASNDDFFKKQLKDTESYYEQRYTQQKSMLDEEKKKWEEAHKREIDLLKKEREDLKESMHVNIERERARLQELHKIEIESKEKLHQYEIERQRHLFEEQNDGLKRQLEAQARLNSLAEEIRMSSTKIHALSDKFEQDKHADEEKRRQELFNKERTIEDRERRLVHEKELIEAERKRLDKLKADIEQREIETMRGLEKERELLKGEYQRLSELQESIKNTELDKKKELEYEKKNLESKKSMLDKENLSLKEDVNKRYHDIELQTQLFESRKQEYEEYLAKSEEALKQKHEEVDNIRKRMTMNESEIIRKLKSIEQKELIISQQLDDLKSKQEIFQMEKISFEREKLKVQEIVGRTKEESEVINKFKREFEAEKEKNQILKLELEKYAQSLQNEKFKIEEEKNGINILQKTLEGLRYNYVKDLNTDKVTTPVNKGLQKESFYGQNPLNFGKKTENNFFVHSNSLPDEPKEYDRPPRDPKMEAKMRGTFTDKRREDHSTDKYVLLKDAKKTDIKSLGDVDSGRGSAKTFNLQNYMSQLKEYDKYTTGNQTYITLEKEGLLKNKIDIETGHLTRLAKGPVNEYGTKSPRYKKKLFTGEEL